MSKNTIFIKISQVHEGRRIEFQAIRALASFFENTGGVGFLSVSKHKLVNKSWPKRR